MHGTISSHRIALPCLQTLAGAALSAAAFGWFLLPRGFAAGGVTGLARLLGNVLPMALPALVLALNLALLALGRLCVGRAFAAKTVAVSVLFPLLLGLFARLPFPLALHSLAFDTLAGGMLLGAGAGLVLRSGASSGGFDVVGVALHRRLGVPVALVMNLCDGIVILLQAAGQPPLPTLCGLAAITISALLVQWVAAARVPPRQMREAG